MRDWISYTFARHLVEMVRVLLLEVVVAVVEVLK
jgi:hypothetical protein